MEHRSHIYGVVAEFKTERELVHAVEKTREAGYRRIEAYTPFPVEGLSEALALKRNNVPLITLIGGLTGRFCGFFFHHFVILLPHPPHTVGPPPHNRTAL